ncbi:hypothetical protein QBC41DRAFT_341592 [Cercophora samala]|uniref:Uncharacterized protein n=1 Tax=Cercophora samala TaxID=330535 RepID=A0AA40D2P2_9PEZI|nr:hypothetical protein QBC41DRAFT_341592 [Cercophora samala]
MMDSSPQSSSKDTLETFPALPAHPALFQHSGRSFRTIWELDRYLKSQRTQGQSPHATPDLTSKGNTLEERIEANKRQFEAVFGCKRDGSIYTCEERLAQMEERELKRHKMIDATVDDAVKDDKDKQDNQNKSKDHRPQQKYGRLAHQQFLPAQPAACKSPLRHLSTARMRQRTELANTPDKKNTALSEGESPDKQHLNSVGSQCLDETTPKILSLRPKRRT